MTSPRGCRVMGAAGIARLVVACAAFALVAPVTSCARRPSSEEIDAPLLAYLSTARALHHEADIAEDGGDVRGAIAPLVRLVSKTQPRPAPEIDEVLADTHARLADLRSRLGNHDEALEEVDLGLLLAPQDSYFRGHLLEVRGLAYERRVKALTSAGDPAGASRAKEMAMKAYEEAIAVQDEVIRRGARDGGRR